MDNKLFLSKGINHIVMFKRSMLLCWEENIWSYHSQNDAASHLTSLPELNILNRLAKHFYEHFLSAPMIVMLG